MNMEMCNKLITFLMLTFIVSFSYAQQYTPMTAAGYQYKRAKVDSTLHIPSFCGVPNLRNSTAIQGALAMDTCANKLYQWTHAAGWSTITTNAIDSLKRSTDSIFARKSGVWVFQYKDSTGGGGSTPSFNDVATVGNFYVNDNGDTLRLNSIDGNDKHPILWTNDFAGGQPTNILDFSYNSGFSNNVAKIKFGESTQGLGTGYIEITDKESIYKNELCTRTIIQNAYSGSSVTQTTYFPLMKGGIDTLATLDDIRNSAIDTSNRFVNNVVKKNDSTITVYKGSTATDITLTPSATVTAATRLVTTVYNNSGSTITKGSVVYINGRHSSNLPTIALAQANTEANSYATFALVQDDITNGNSGTIIQAGNIGNLNLPTSSYADGEVVYLSPTIAGGLTINKSSVLAPNHIVKIGTITRAHPTFGSIEIKIENGWQLDELSDVKISVVPNDSTLFQFSRVDSLWHDVSVTNAIGNKYLKPTDTASLSSRINLKVNIADTATMLSKYLRKTDTASLSNRIDLRVKYTDTATMLTPYLRKIDTASLSSRINLKVNISDTATMLSKYLRKTDTASLSSRIDLRVKYTDTATMLTPYLRKIDTTNRFVNNISRTVGKDSIIFNIGSTRYAIKDSVGGGTSYTFSTGLTNSSGTVTSNLSTGVAGGQSVVGGTAASNSLTLSSTSNATKGKILFGTSAYDEVNNRLGIGTASPSFALDVNGTARISTSDNSYNQQVYIQNTNAGTTALTGLLLRNSAGTDVGQFTYIPSNYIVAAQANQVSFGSVGQTKLSFGANTSANGAAAQDIIFSTLGTNSTYQMQIKGNGNVQINTNTDAGYRFDVNGTTRVQGALNFNPTNTASGTTGNQTINKASGTVNIAAAGTTVTVTNSLVTASSIVYAVIRTNDATATIKNVVPSAGSFVINLGAAATAEVSIGFFVIN